MFAPYRVMPSTSLLPSDAVAPLSAMVGCTLQISEVPRASVCNTCEVIRNRVRYEVVNAMLLNEFLKEHQRAAEEHRMVEQQQATIAELKSSSAKHAPTVAEQQKQITALTAGLKEQVLKIQKVSKQLELTKSAPQLIANTH